MGRIIAIDYGLKRCGIAVTDPLKIIASGLKTVETSTILSFLQNYFKEEQVDHLVLGYPTDLKSQDTDLSPKVRAFYEVLKQHFPNLNISFIDERFSSKIAAKVIHELNLKKKQKQQKENLDLISATILLQDYMGL
jgi:putative holliday junction resolvase